MTSSDAVAGILTLFRACCQVTLSFVPPALPQPAWRSRHGSDSPAHGFVGGSQPALVAGSDMRRGPRFRAVRSRFLSTPASGSDVGNRGYALEKLDPEGCTRKGPRALSTPMPQLGSRDSDSDNTVTTLVAATRPLAAILVRLGDAARKAVLVCAMLLATLLDGGNRCAVRQ